jgi:large subunit ribosomal protein L7/L12
VELIGIDATKKINIIKEVRQLLNLGLKEAKDLVEKPPAILKKQVKKAEAEELSKKLSALGC